MKSTYVHHIKAEEYEDAVEFLKKIINRDYSREIYVLMNSIDEKTCIRGEVIEKLHGFNVDKEKIEEKIRVILAYLFKSRYDTSIDDFNIPLSFFFTEIGQLIKKSLVFENDILINANQVAFLKGCSRMNITNLIEDGKINVYTKLGKVYIFKLSHIMPYVENREGLI